MFVKAREFVGTRGGQPLSVLSLSLKLYSNEVHTVSQKKRKKKKRKEMRFTHVGSLRI